MELQRNVTFSHIDFNCLYTYSEKELQPILMCLTCSRNCLYTYSEKELQRSCSNCCILLNCLYTYSEKELQLGTLQLN